MSTMLNKCSFSELRADTFDKERLYPSPALILYLINHEIKKKFGLKSSNLGWESGMKIAKGYDWFTAPLIRMLHPRATFLARLSCESALFISLCVLN